MTFAAEVQVSGGVAVLPIQGSPVAPLSAPDKVSFAGTAMYGEMKFRNVGDSLGIVPAGFGVVSKQRGQDHALNDAFVLSPHAERASWGAVCIQSNQAGYLKEEEDLDSEIVLPPCLRRALRGLDGWRADASDFTRLWPSISWYLDRIPGLKRKGKAHLSDLYLGRAGDLAEFAMAFEPIEYQLGAVVFFGGRLVGVEVMPTAEYWTRYWQPVLRGAYGAEYLIANAGRPLESKPVVLSGSLSASDFVAHSTARESVEEIIKGVTHQYAEEYGKTKMSVEEHEVDSDSDSAKVFRVWSDEGEMIGDVVKQGGLPIYASVVW